MHVAVSRGVWMDGACRSVWRVYASCVWVYGVWRVFVVRVVRVVRFVWCALDCSVSGVLCSSPASTNTQHDLTHKTRSTTSNVLIVTGLGFSAVNSHNLTTDRKTQLETSRALKLVEFARHIASWQHFLVDRWQFLNFQGDAKTYL